MFVDILLLIVVAVVVWRVPNPNRRHTTTANTIDNIITLIIDKQPIPYFNGKRQLKAETDWL